jgi:hypothetical protein
MKLPKYRIGDPILPTESDATWAQASSHILASYLQHQEGSCTIKLMEDETKGETVEVPAIALFSKSSSILQCFQKFLDC